MAALVVSISGDRKGGLPRRASHRGHRAGEASDCRLPLRETRPVGYRHPRLSRQYAGLPTSRLRPEKPAARPLGYRANVGRTSEPGPDRGLCLLHASPDRLSGGFWPMPPATAKTCQAELGLISRGNSTSRSLSRQRLRSRANDYWQSRSMAWTRSACASVQARRSQVRSLSAAASTTWSARAGSCNEGKLPTPSCMSRAGGRPALHRRCGRGATTLAPQFARLSKRPPGLRPSPAGATRPERLS